jgi:hypothetical protein
MSEVNISAENRLKDEFQKKREAHCEDVLRVLLSTFNGRVYLWHLLEIGKWNTQPFSPDEKVMSFNCGELNVGQRVLDEIINVDPSGFVTMMQENADARHALDRAINDLRNADGGENVSDADD